METRTVKLKFSKPQEVINYLADISHQKWLVAKATDKYFVTYRIKKVELLDWLNDRDEANIDIRYIFNATGSKWTDWLRIRKGKLLVDRTQLSD